MNKELIISEYNKAEIWYKALQALIKSEGLSLDSAAGTAVQTPSQNAQEQKPQESGKQETTQQTAPTAPGISYTGKIEYTIAPNETVKFSVYFNGVKSTSEYRIMPYGSNVSQTISAFETKTGFRVDFVVKGVRTGQGSYKMYIKSEPEKELNIIINVK